jgi:hypothetical protein
MQNVPEFCKTERQMVIFDSNLDALIILCKENEKKVENPETTRVSEEGYQWLNANSQGYMTPVREK